MNQEKTRHEDQILHHAQFADQARYLRVRFG